LAERDKRIKPGLDDKAITSWNALMISGYAKAYQVFDEPEFLKMAKCSADFILENLLIDKRLYRIYKNGKVSIPAFAEDYACLTEALIQLYQVTFEEKYLLEANALMELSISYFYDADRKFFYFTSINDEALIVRRIDFNDDVIPSANSVFAKCLQMLMYYFSKTDYENILDGMLQSIKPKIDKYPTGYSNWLQVMLNKEKGLYQIVLSGKDYKVAQNELDQMYLPNAVYALVQKDTQIPLLNDKPMSDALSIYVCIDKTCGLPQNNVQSVVAMLKPSCIIYSKSYICPAYRERRRD
jgi:uncharacterized protein YyaL (SSP411 family)